MDIEVKIVGREGIPQNERKDIQVEHHAKRGDVYNVMKIDTMLEGDTVTFRVPDGGRLMITTPEGDNEIVYDAAQGAAVRRGSQENDEGKADDPRTGAQRGPSAKPMTEAEAAAERRRLSQQGAAGGTIKADLGQGRQGVMQSTPVDLNAPQMGASHTTTQPPTEAKKYGTSPTPEEAKAKAEAEAKAKSMQQSGAGRPAGEKPPAAGSPVGSPPSGNEGTK